MDVALVTKCAACYGKIRVSYAVLAINIAVKGILPAVITNKMEHSSFKCEHIIWIATHSKQTWIIAL